MFTAGLPPQDQLTSFFIKKEEAVIVEDQTLDLDREGQKSTYPSILLSEYSFLFLVRLMKDLL